MSLAIDVDKVTRVLLADGWHDVANDSFSLDAYEYLWHHRGADRDPMVLHGGGQSGICSNGFAFTDPDGRHLCGPLTAVLAVETK
jgi:hypothetical protein